MQNPFCTPTLCRRSIHHHQVSEFVKFVSVCVANGGLSCLDFRVKFFALVTIEAYTWHCEGQCLFKFRTNQMESTVALRQEKLEVQAVQGRGTGRVKARAGALSLPSSKTSVQLAFTSKCAPALHQPHSHRSLGILCQVLHMLQTRTSMHYIAVVLSSAGRCLQRNFLGEGTQLGWTEVLCPASRQAPNIVLHLKMLTIRQSCQAGASRQHQ